jgi:hypothetical protein
MTEPRNPVELVDFVADVRLLTADSDDLPADVGRPATIAPSRSRRRIVGVGATLTGGSLVVGVALIALSALELILGNFGVLEIVAVIIGLVLIGTHWGWVHVAEASADAIESRRNGEIVASRQRWLAAIQPYTRYEVSTRVGDDGSITIVRVRYRPIPAGERSFTFVREVTASEIHSGDEPGAAVAERAELLRRQAAKDTERAREQFQIAHDVHETALLDQADEAQILAARRAASEALSDQINANLRDPPLVE